jgi:hypothetical protein
MGRQRQSQGAPDPASGAGDDGALQRIFAGTGPAGE